MSVDGFNYDNVFIRLLNRVGDVMILSLVFVVSCIPIFTIGTAITAMYYACMKSLEIEDGYVFKFYIKSFKDNFKQSTVIWLISFGVLAVLGVDVWFWYNQWKANDSTMLQAMLIISIIMVSVAVMIVMYVFPLQAKFDNETKTQFRNAFLLSIKYFPTTILLALILAIVVWMFYFQWILSVVGFALFGFGIMGYIYSFFMLRCFRPFLAPKRSIDDELDGIADEDDFEEDTESEESDHEINEEKIEKEEDGLGTEETVEETVEE